MLQYEADLIDHAIFKVPRALPPHPQAGRVQSEIVLMNLKDEAGLPIA